MYKAIFVINLLLKEFVPLRFFCRFVLTKTSCLLPLGLIEGKECP